MRKVIIAVIVAVLLVTLFMIPSTQAAEKALPKVITMTAYSVGTAIHIFASSASQVIGMRTPFKCRVEPGASDTARVLPLKDGTTELGLWTEATAIMLSRGLGSVFERVGPQPIRHVWVGANTFNHSPWVSGTSKIYTVADAKGKRWPDIFGVDAHLFGCQAVAAFGGYTFNDVIKVPMNGYTSQYPSLLEDRTDIAFGATTSSAAMQQASSPQGIRWINLDPNDKEGWARLHKIAPWMMPLHGEIGANVTPQNPVDGIGYPDPVVAYDHADEKIIYHVVKALHTGYDQLKTMHPVLVGWTIETALDIEMLELFMIPYHPGAIRYFKEIGKWTPRHEAMQAKALDLEKQRIAKFKKK